MRKHLLAVAALGVTAPQIAWAERPSDRAWINLGVFRADVDSDLRLDNQTLGIEGTHVDFERDLGLDSSRWLPKINAGVRIGKRFRLEADYFRLNRSADVILTKTLRIDDTVFPLAADVHTSFRSDIYRIAAGYSFIRQDHAELGVAVGAHASRGKFRIQGNAGFAALEEHRSTTAPLPNVGLFGTVDLFGPVALQGNIDAFAMKYHGYKGSLIDGHLGLNARVTRNIGVGVGYRYAHYKIRANKRDWRGTLTYEYQGPMAFLELAL